MKIQDHLIITNRRTSVLFLTDLQEPVLATMFGAKKVSYFTSASNTTEDDPYNFDASIADFSSSKKKGKSKTAEQSNKPTQQQQKAPPRTSNPNESVLDRASSLLKSYGSSVPVSAVVPTNKAPAFSRRLSRSYDEDAISLDDDEDDELSSSFGQSQSLSRSQSLSPRSSFSVSRDADKDTLGNRKLSTTAAAGVAVMRGMDASRSVYEAPSASRSSTLTAAVASSTTRSTPADKYQIYSKPVSSFGASPGTNIDAEESISISESINDSIRMNECR